MDDFLKFLSWLADNPSWALAAFSIAANVYQARRADKRDESYISHIVTFSTTVAELNATQSRALEALRNARAG